MRLGAVLIAAGTQANPMLPSGEITVAQRMIATLQKAGVTQIAVVTGPDDRKMEKQLARYGVFFLQNPQPEEEGTSIALGLAYLEGKCEQIFLMEADHPLMTPDTVVALLASGEDMVLPVYRGQRGQPLLVKSGCTERLSGVKKLSAIAELPDFFPLGADDPGVILTAREAEISAESVKREQCPLYPGKRYILTD